MNEMMKNDTVVELDLENLDVQELELRVEFKPWVSECTATYDIDDQSCTIGVKFN